MVQHLAASYCSQFHFRSEAGCLCLALSDYAPPDLKTLVAELYGTNPTQEQLTCLYVAFCALADQQAHMAPEQCAEDVLGEVRRRLEDAA